MGILVLAVYILCGYLNWKMLDHLWSFYPELEQAWRKLPWYWEEPLNVVGCFVVFPLVAGGPVTFPFLLVFWLILWPVSSSHQKAQQAARMAPELVKQIRALPASQQVAELQRIKRLDRHLYAAVRLQMHEAPP
jgi:hypothetical protein